MYVDPSMDGLSSADLETLGMLAYDYASSDDLDNLLRDSGKILAAMREAVSRGDVDLVEKLDALYEEIQELINEVVSGHPVDQLDPRIDGNQFD